MVVYPSVLIVTAAGFGGLAAWAWLVYVTTWWSAALWVLAVASAWLVCGAGAGFWFAWYVRRHLGHVWVQHQGFWIWMAVWRTLLGPIGLAQTVYYFLLRDRLLHAFWNLQDAWRGAR